MSVEELIARLIANREDGNQEGDHGDADGILLDYINNQEVTEALTRLISGIPKVVEGLK